MFLVNIVVFFVLVFSPVKLPIPCHYQVSGRPGQCQNNPVKILPVLVKHF